MNRFKKYINRKNYYKLKANWTGVINSGFPMMRSNNNGQLANYKDMHKGDSAILYATGSSIKNYRSIGDPENFVHIGLNRIYNYPNIIQLLDYYFFGSEYYLDLKHRQKVDSISKNNTFTLFASSYEEGISHAIINRGNISPEDAQKIGAIPFENNLNYFTNEIAKYSLLGHSIVFPALQFILYTGIRELYLVGCDGGFTAEDKKHYGDNHLIRWWKEFNNFKKRYYQNVRIVSINPVSLKGMFHDKIVK